MNHLDLCSGYGGASLVAESLGYETVAFAEINPAACKVLACHWPDVPNLGDLRAVDWVEWGDIDLLTAGFPCQPASSAGRRKGMHDDRWLWPEIARAVRLVRPRIVFLENVPGLLSVDEGRAFNAGLSDLAAVGYVGSWLCLSASEVGACHRRERVFIVAAGVDGQRRRSDTQLDGHASPRAANGVPQGRHPDGRGRAEGLSLLPTPLAADGNGGKQHRIGSISDTGRTEDGRKVQVSLRDALSQLVGSLLPTPRTSDANGAGPHGDGGLRTARAELDRWGKFADAIARHEAVLGREAPSPLNGKSLSPRFVEWMMMLPEGWVTDCGISRTAALRLLGNGWVPAQARAAFGLARDRLGMFPREVTQTEKSPQVENGPVYAIGVGE